MPQPDFVEQRQAGQIRSLRGIETVIETAARYGVTESNVRQIQDGKTWAGTGKMHIWRPEDDTDLRTGIDLGLTMPQLAKRLGKTFYQVAGRMYRLGLRSRSGYNGRSA
jgi:hypothetical protein